MPPQSVPVPGSSDDARERAFDALFRANYAGLCRFVGRMLDSAGQAEDVVQELFSYIWERHEAITEETPSRAYLYRAAHNAALNRIRHVRVERRWADAEAVRGEPQVSPADHGLDYEALLVAVDRAVERLPEGCRLVYTMSRQDKLTYQEIATALGISVKTVEGQMARAFRLLRKALTPFIALGLFALIVS